MKTRHSLPFATTLAGLLVAGSALAQYPSPSPATGSMTGTTSSTATRTTTTSTISNGEVIAVSGSQMIVKTAEGYRQIMVAPDYRFTINGQQMAIASVKPGMKFTGTVQTSGTPVTLTTNEMRNVEVVSTDAGTVVIKDASGTQKTFSDRDFSGMDVVIMKDGRVVATTDLKPGDRITALMLTEGAGSASLPAGTTTGSTNTPGSTPTDRYSATGVPSGTGTTGTTGTTDVASTTRYDEDRNLPKTASPWPLVGLAGVLLLGIGGAMTLARRLYVG